MKNLFHLVMAHAEAQAIFDRHLPFWNRQGPLAMVMCPQDLVIRTTLPVLALGTKGHHNPASIRRFKQMISVILDFDYDYYAIDEYDSMCLSDSLPQVDGAIQSNLFTADQKEFKGHYFLHPPLVCSHPTLTKIWTSMSQLGDEEEGSFWDRHLGYACELGGIPMKGYGSSGFSKNTIEQSDIPAAVAARKAGASMFHGIKSEAVLNALLSA